MTRRMTRTLLGLLVSCLVSGSAYAQATRTWVSGVGDDFNPCSRTAPCKTFAGAYPKTAAGGEISVLDPGGYGAVTIGKSLTINGVGENASILGSLVNGIVINQPGVLVTIRNLHLQGAGTGLVGIRLRRDSVLIVEHTSISGFQYAVHVDEGQAVISNSSLLSSQFVGASASGGTLSVERSLIANNGIGVQASGGTIRLSGNMIFNNVTSFACGAGSVVSASNNSVAGGPSPCPPAGGLIVQ
jgi:hypothetical protein